MPADDKENARLIVSQIILEALQGSRDGVPEADRKAPEGIGLDPGASLGDDERSVAGMKHGAASANVGAVVAVRGSVVDVRFDEQLAADLLGAARRRRRAHRHRSAGAAGCASRARDRVDAHAGSRARHGGGGHGRAAQGAGGQRGSLADVRRVRQHHRPRGSAVRRPMAFRASGSAAAGATLHQVRDLRDGHQGHRRARAAGARRQGGAVRRGGRGQDGAAHRDDPQHDRPPGRRQHLLRHRRALSRRRGALPRHEGGRRAAEHGDGLRPDERAAGQPVPRRATRR